MIRRKDKAMAPKKKSSGTPIEALKHKDKRKNIPTEELRDFVAEDKKSPARTWNGRCMPMWTRPPGPPFTAPRAFCLTRRLPARSPSRSSTITATRCFKVFQV